MAVEGDRIGDRVHAVERMGEVDEAALLADRGDRVGERQAAGDLLAEEEADHLALRVRLDLLAGDDDQLAVAGALDGLERAAEDVVVGDGDRAEAFRLGVVEQLVDLDRAVVRPGRVHVQVGDDPRPVGERPGLAARRAAAGAEARVERVQLARDVGEVADLRPRRSRPSAAASPRRRRGGRSRRRRAPAARPRPAAPRRRPRPRRPRAAGGRSRSEPARRWPPRRAAPPAPTRRGPSARARARAARAGWQVSPRAPWSGGGRSPSPAAPGATVGPRGRRATSRNAARPRSAAASRSAGRGRGRRPAGSPGSRRGIARPRRPPSPRRWRRGRRFVRAACRAAPGAVDR